MSAILFGCVQIDQRALDGWRRIFSLAVAIGDASQATAAKGEAVINYWAGAFIDLVKDVERFDLSNLRSAL